MKALLIMHGKNDQIIKKARTKRRFLHERLGCQIDLCIYGINKETDTYEPVERKCSDPDYSG